ncbi:MAG TPA: hypothetical protein VGM82_23310 [Gemmatimonadaceae bacterium]|jgi:hypothetical protein
MTNIRRAVVGTAALLIGGFVVGALVGATASIILYFPDDGWRMFTRAGGGAMTLRNAVIAGAITSLATPLLAWIGLRRVPIGRIIALGALGTAGGALGAALIVGPILPTQLWGLTSPIVGAAAGGMLAAALLRWTVRTRRSASTAHAV